MRRKEWLEVLLFKLVVLLWSVFHPRKAHRVGAATRALRADAKKLRRSLENTAGVQGARQRADLGFASTRRDFGANPIGLYLMRRRLGKPLREDEERLQLTSFDELSGSMGHILHLQAQLQEAITAPEPRSLDELIDHTLELIVRGSATADDLAFAFEPVACSRLEPLVCRRGEDAFFQRVRADIEAARSHINIAMYGTRDEGNNPQGTARRMVDLLTGKAAEGVQVNFLYDAFGTGTVGPREDVYSRALIYRMQEKGVHCIPNDPWNIHNTETLLRLDHRKLYVIDGKTVYVGGMGIEDQFENDGPDKECHDVMARVEGEVVKQFQCAFLSSYVYQLINAKKNAGPIFGNDKNHLREIYFPEVNGGQDNLMATCLMNTPVSGLREISDRYIRMAESAEDHVYFMNPHCSDDNVTNSMRKSAARLRAAGKNWSPGGKPQGALGLFPDGELGGLGEGVIRHEFPGLLGAGMAILLYSDGWLHGKVAVQDSSDVVVGSCNLDTFSMERNWEIAVYAADGAVAERVISDIFRRDEPPASHPAEGEFSIWTRIKYAFMDLVDRWF